MTRTLAVVDLGSNSFHMLVARADGNRLSLQDTLKEPVRLRMGLGADGSISDEARERALSCLRRFAQRLAGVDHIRVVGTNTMRRARDTRAFLKEIEDILDVPVDVIGGMEEARLIYLGVASNRPPSDKRNLVIDIGGGSTEFIIGRNLEYTARESRPMGCVSFTMNFFSDGVVTKKRFNKAVLRVGQELESYQQLLDKENWDVAIGSSGTIKAVGHVVKAMGGGDVITREAMDAIRDSIPFGRPFHTDPPPGIREDRLTVFAGGFAVLYGIFEVCGITEMEISQHSMREGLLLDSLGRDSNRDIREETVEHLKTFYSVDVQQAERVKKTARILFQQFMGMFFNRRQSARKLLDWAADLHEIGLAIAHSGYHKHGAYVILNGDLDGFSRVEQCLLGFLVLNHRKRLKLDPMDYETEHEMPLVFILRLAVILNRGRVELDLPDIAINWRKRQIQLQIDANWLEQHPLTRLDLDMELGWWKRAGYSMAFNNWN